MNFIGIDLSVNSTAMTIYNGSYLLYNYTTKNSNNSWINKLNGIINFRFFEFLYKEYSNFSDILLDKILQYDLYTDLIINDIKNIDDDAIIGLEGYNYGLKRTDTIVDITELSSIFKYKLIKTFPSYKIIILPPKSVKIKTCEMVYGMNGKISRNKNGIAGGNFDKNNMFDAFIDSNIDIKDFRNFLVDKDVNKLKNIPKPVDDIIDSIFISEIIKRYFNI